MWGWNFRWSYWILSAETLPHVQSAAYGNEGEGQSQQYRDRLSTEFSKLGARGVSVIVSSGDYGTGCYLYCDEAEILLKQD